MQLLIFIVFITEHDLLTHYILYFRLFRIALFGKGTQNDIPISKNTTYRTIINNRDYSNIQLSPYL